MKRSEIHILIVDDDASIQEVLRQAIKRLGYKVSVASKPSEAEAIAKIKTVHLAIVDCMLPIMNGVHLSKNLITATSNELPVILISGIFKDEQFITEALKKSGAKEFFVKPLHLSELSKTVNEYLAPLLDAKSGSMQSILTKTHLTTRESRKLIEYMDEVTGNDLMLVLSVLSHGKLSGYLSLTDPDENIFGVTFSEGEIVDVDALKSHSFLLSVLQKYNLASATEFANISAQLSRKNPLADLVGANIISPHLANQVREQCLSQEIKKLISCENLRVAFSESEVFKPSSEYVLGREKLIHIIRKSIFDKVDISSLKNFYSGWEERKVVIDDSFEKFINTYTFSGVSEKGFMSLLKLEPTIESLISQFGDETTYRWLHFLTVSRLVSFKTNTQSKDLDEQVRRLKDIESNIKDKNAFEIFEFFGAGANPRSVDVERIYKEFVKSNHPDKLPNDAKKEIVELCNRVFSMVSAAHNILMDESLRADLYDKLEEGEARKQVRAEELVERAQLALQKSLYEDARDLLTRARDLHVTDELFMCEIWLDCKKSPERVKRDFTDLQNTMNAYDRIKKKSTLWLYTMGLLHLAVNDTAEAEAYFKRCLDKDRGFLLARRELAVVKSSSKSGKMSTTDIFTGDLSDVVSHFFGNKKG